MKTLVTRALSALAAIFIVFVLFHYFDVRGMQFLCSLAAFVGSLELTRILFFEGESKTVKTFFFGFSFSSFLVASLWPDFAAMGFASFCVLFCIVALFFQNKFEDLISLQANLGKGIMGFFYIGLLPSFAYRLLALPNGINWFIALLAIVFAGDTLAYLAGSLWGKHKLMPKISPKKSIEGSLGGLLGSILAGALTLSFLPNVPFWTVIVLAAIVGIVAQLGDLYESMLKRVADVKDSGSLMPGHGGILDRLDGVLFASPILLLGASLLELIYK